MSLNRREFVKRAGGLGLGASLLGGVPGLLEACGNASTSSSTSAVKPVKGGHVTEATAQDVVGFNTITNMPGISLLLSTFLFDGLLSTDNAGNLTPATASALPKVSADQMTYTFTLRKDVKWSDGRPLTADDVVFTYNLAFDPAYKAVTSTYRSDMETNVTSIQAPDPYTVVFNMKRPNAPFLAAHGLHGIMPKHVLGQLGAAQINSADFNKAPNVVNGVFKFVEWKQGDHITLARNDSYYRGAAYLDQYVFKIVGSEASTVPLLSTGEVDCSRIQGTANFDPLNAQSSLAAQSFFTNTIVTWFYNLDTSRPAGKFLSDPKVRQALTYAVDRNAWINSVYLKVGANAGRQLLPAQLLGV